MHTHNTQPIRAHYFVLALPVPRSNPTRYKYPTQSFHWHTSFTCLWRWNRQWVPKCRQLELRRRGITQKGTNYTNLVLWNTYRYVQVIDQASPVFMIFTRELRLLFFKAIRHRFTTLVLYFPTEKKNKQIRCRRVQLAIVKECHTSTAKPKAM